MSPSVSQSTESHPSSRRYSESFKLNAACLVLEQNLSIQKVAEKLHCAPMSVRHWVDQYRDHVAGQRPDSGILSDSVAHRQSASIPKSQNPMPFLPIQVVEESASSTSTPHYEIVTRGGLTLRLSGETAVRTIIELVRELESSPC